MSEPIRIKYLWDRENVENLFESSYKYLFNHSAKRYIGWLFVAILQFGVVAALKKGSIGLLLFSSVVLAYWYYGKKIIAKKRMNSAFEKSSFRDKSIQITVDSKGFDIKSHEGRTHWNWDEIDEVIPLEDDILLYKHPHFHYIPAKGFVSLEEKNRFKALAREKKKLKGV